MVWKNIPGWEGHYQACTNGQIRSVTRTVKCFWMGKKRIRIYKGRVLTTKACSKYAHVNFSRNSKTICKNVHDLILLTFKGPKPKGKEVLHKNGVREDNRLINLRYGTSAENAADKFKHGFRVPRGSKNKRSKFNAQERKELKKLLKLGYSINGLAAVFDVSHGCMTDALRVP